MAASISAGPPPQRGGAAPLAVPAVVAVQARRRRRRRGRTCRRTRPRPPVGVGAHRLPHAVHRGPDLVVAGLAPHRRDAPRRRRMPPRRFAPIDMAATIASQRRRRRSATGRAPASSQVTLSRSTPMRSVRYRLAVGVVLLEQVEDVVHPLLPVRPARTRPSRAGSRGRGVVARPVLPPHPRRAREVGLEGLVAPDRRSMSTTPSRRVAADLEAGARRPRSSAASRLPVSNDSSGCRDDQVVGGRPRGHVVGDRQPLVAHLELTKRVAISSGPNDTASR